MKNRNTALLAVVASAVAVPFTLADGPEADYSESFQLPVFNWNAKFHVSGPATGHGYDVQGDAMLDSVEYRSGESFNFYFKPVAVRDISYSGDQSKWSVRVGTNTTNTGLSGTYTYGAADGEPDDVTDEDKAAFSALMLQALQSNNLNAYVDLNSSTPRFEFTLEFNVQVMDNDPDPDDFGEILFIERGAGYGNSWVKLQAVDAAGNALGPWLVVSPYETLQTTPVTTVYRWDQKMGTTAIDVSRLGVTEVRYLKVSNDVPIESAYAGGGDLNPDFKIMAVVTNPEQLKLYSGTYD